MQQIKAIPHNSKCRYGERGAADAKPKAQPDIIEHFGNADAVPQPPERCLSRQAGIVRCCLKKKKYPDSLHGYTGNLLMVAINYDKKSKKHQCIIEKIIQ